MRVLSIDNKEDLAILRSCSEPVLKEEIPALLPTIKKMKSTLLDANGVGLAGAQVGIPKRFFLVLNTDEDKIYTFINPVITGKNNKLERAEEGCLSVPGRYAKVSRPISIEIEATNEKGARFKLEAQDFFARVILHEFDHIEGVIFLDYLPERLRKKWVPDYAGEKKKS